MLTFEKVLEIFKDYLALDTELEVCKSRYGYIRVEFNAVSYTHLTLPTILLV